MALHVSLYSNIFLFRATLCLLNESRGGGYSLDCDSADRGPVPRKLPVTDGSFCAIMPRLALYRCMSHPLWINAKKSLTPRTIFCSCVCLSPADCYTGRFVT
ncbi:hypothetical protein FKM82_007824 [Ascaphus truei]